MNYKLVYHPDVRKDIKTLNKKQRDTVQRAIKARLLTEPEKYFPDFEGAFWMYILVLLWVSLTAA